jgi:hypothetical protein
LNDLLDEGFEALLHTTIGLQRRRLKVGNGQVTRQFLGSQSKFRTREKNKNKKKVKKENNNNNNKKNSVPQRLL